MALNSPTPPTGAWIKQWLGSFLTRRGPAVVDPDDEAPLAKLKSGWNLLEVVGVYVLVFVLGYVYAYFVQDYVYGLSYSLFGDWADQAQFAIATSLEMSILVWLVGVVARRSGGAWRDVGVVRKVSWAPVLIGLASGFVIYYLVGFCDYIVSLIGGIRPNEHPVVAIVNEARNWREMVLPMLLAGLAVPLGEEVFFRGFAYPALRNRLGVWPAIIVTGLAFALLHFDPFGLLALTAAGVALTFLYERTGSLWSVLIAHGVWNILVAAGLFISGLR
ncbi:MAG: lysostaphin resistance A-like protein [Chloroflexota bacterium]